VKSPLPRNATLATLLLLLVTGAAFAQGAGRHAAGRGGPAASPTGLAYGAGYQVRQMRQAEREGQRAHQANTKTDGECLPATTPARETEPASAKDAGQTRAPAHRDACVAAKP
jgi:hypothetical protein